MAHRLHPSSRSLRGIPTDRSNCHCLKALGLKAAAIEEFGQNGKALAWPGRSLLWGTVTRDLGLQSGLENWRAFVKKHKQLSVRARCYAYTNPS